MSRPQLSLTVPAAGRATGGAGMVAETIEWVVEVHPSAGPRAYVTVRGRDDEFESAGVTRFATVILDGRWWLVSWPKPVPPTSFVMAGEEFLEDFAEKPDSVASVGSAS